jgi:hypothetical protein
LGHSVRAGVVAEPDHSPAVDVTPTYQDQSLRRSWILRVADDPLEAWRHAIYLPNPPTPPDLTLVHPLDQSLLVKRENRVNPGGSQRWDQARDYGNHNKEQSCSRYAYGVRGTDMV